MTELSLDGSGSDNVHGNKVDRKEKWRQGWLAQPNHLGYLARRIPGEGLGLAEMQQPEYDRSRVGAYLGLGLTFALSTLFFAWLGSLLDGRLGTTPAFTLLGAFIGAGAGFYNLVRRAMDLQKSEKPKKNERDGNTEPSGKARDIQ